MNKRSRAFLALLMILGILTVFAGCTGGSVNVEDYQAKETEQEKYNNLSDEGIFVLYREGLAEDDLEKIREKKFEDLTAEEKAEFEQFKKNNYYYLDIETEEIKNSKGETESTRKYYVLRYRITGKEWQDSGFEGNTVYVDMYTRGYKFVKDADNDSLYTLVKLTEDDKELKAPATPAEKAAEAEKYNKLSENGKFVLFAAENALEGKKLSDLDDAEKEQFEKYKISLGALTTIEEAVKDENGDYLKDKDNAIIKETRFKLNVLELKDVDRPGDKVMIDVTDKDGNPVLDENGAQVKMNKFYIEMKDRGFKFIDDKKDNVSTGKYTLEAAEKTSGGGGGLFSFILKPIGIMMNFINRITHSYILALFIFAVLVKVLLFPFGLKQQKSMVKQAYFKPKERAIRNKYKGRNDKATQQKCQQEVMEAQQAEGVSAFGGCLPLLIQLPIILLLYDVIRNPLSYVARYSSSLISTLRNILCYNSTAGLTLTDNIRSLVQSSAVSRITELDMVPVLRDNWTCFADVSGMSEKAVSDLPNFYAIGNKIDLSFTPTFSTSGLNYLYLLIPVITFFALYYSTKLNKKMTGVLNQKMEGAPDMGIAGKIMDFAMPALSAFFTFQFPAVLGVYWIFNNLLGTVQQFVLNKIRPFPVFTEEDYKRAEKEYNKGKENVKKKVVAEVEDVPREKKKSAYDDEDGEYPVLPPMDDDDDSVYIKKNGKKGKLGAAPIKKDEKNKDQTNDNSDDKSDKE